MRLKNFALLLVAVCCGSSTAYSQVTAKPKPIDNSIDITTKKTKAGIFAAQELKGKISGAGLFSYNNGSLYVGDFRDQAFHGRGMYIPDGGDTIANCPGAAIYVGRFKEGVKHGRGKCYNAEGKMIYHGRFADDKPTEEYPSSAEASARTFVDLVTPEFYYIGEYANDAANGFGAIFTPEGDFVVSRFNDGELEGISTFILKNGEWCVQKHDAETDTIISSSTEYAAIKQQTQATLKASAKEVFSGVVEVLDAAAGVTKSAAELTTAVASPSKSTTSSVSSKKVVKNSAASVEEKKAAAKKTEVGEQQSLKSNKLTTDE